ncbi:alanine racemase [Microbacterium sp. NPDC089318]
MTSAPELTISRTAFRSNIAAVAAQIAPSRLMLVVKDDAYRHGLDWAVEAADGVRWFGAYDVATALRVRALRPDARVFAWALATRDEVDMAIAADVDLGVGTMPYLQRVIASASGLGATARVHLKIDTGLHRNGVRPEQWPAFVAAAMQAQQSGILRVVGAWSHLSEASDADDDESAAVFRTATAALRAAGADLEVEHLTASAASWWRPELRGSICRVGAFCYGIRSGDGPRIPGVVPIATLTANVDRVADDGVEVGIGSLHGLPSTLAGQKVGTPDGLRRILAVGAHSSIVERWAGAAVGDRVRIHGPGDQGEPDVTALGERIDSIGEEIALRLSPRVRRVVVD